MLDLSPTRARCSVSCVVRRFGPISRVPIFVRGAWVALLLAACGTSPIEPDAGPMVDAGSDTGVDAGPASCPGSPSCPACSNGADDDGDELVDYPLDPGCERREDDDEGEPPPPGPCANGEDDDDDGLIDYPADPGCSDEEDLDETDPPPPACDDGADGDGDGAADYPDDPGCLSARDDDESDTCPSGPDCPACANDADDDGDGATDYPGDAECGSASDDDERCALVGGFDDEWPGPWVDQFGTPPFMVTRRGAAAHDGAYGVIDPIFMLVNPSVTTGADGESASVWVKALQEPSGVMHALHFAISDAGSHACMLDLAGRLVVYTAPRDSDGSVLAMVAAPRERDVWYRLEVAFLASNVAECRVYAEGGVAPLATVSHTFATALSGPIGVRGASLSAFDTVEVCR